MSQEARVLSTAELRESFDRAFAKAPESRDEDSVAMLFVRLGENRYAIGLDEIGAISIARPITPIPGSRMPLLGVAGIRGEIVAVYSLPELLGQVGGGSLRWFAICRREEPLALAFDVMEEYRRVPRAALGSSADEAVRFCRGIIQVDGTARYLLDINSVVATIQTAAAAPAPPGIEGT